MEMSMNNGCNHQAQQDRIEIQISLQLAMSINYNGLNQKEQLFRYEIMKKEGVVGGLIGMHCMVNEAPYYNLEENRERWKNGYERRDAQVYGATNLVE